MVGNIIFYIFVIAGVIAATRPSFGSSKKDVCIRLYRRVLPHYRKLTNLLPPEQQEKLPSQVVGNDPSEASMCNRINVNTSLDFFTKLLATHQQHVAVILDSQMNDPQKTVIFGAIEKVMQKHSPDTKLTRHAPFKGQLNKTMAQLVLNEKVSLIIAWTDQRRTQALEYWAEGLKLPTILLAPKAAARKRYHSFYVFPQEHGLGETLIQHVQRLKVKRVGLLEPKSSASRSSLAPYLTRHMPKNTKVKHYTYTDGKYHSMEDAAKKLFGIDRSARREEFQELYMSAKEAAEATGEEFDPRFVFLPPKNTVDAVIILDDFKAVRHFVKIFRFLGVRKLPLLGTQKWRSRSLVEPKDDYLEGAVFADYIGNYYQLPKYLDNSLATQPYLISARRSALLDVTLIAGRAAFLAAKVMQPKSNRYYLSDQLSKLHLQEDSKYFGVGEVFDTYHRSNWPGFLLKVSGQDLRLHARKTP